MDDRSSPIWYSSQALGQMEIYQMLTRAMMIKTDSDLSDSGSRWNKDEGSLEEPFTTELIKDLFKT